MQDQISENPTKKTSWLSIRKTAPVLGVAVVVLIGIVLNNLFYPPPQPPTPQEINTLISSAMASATPPVSFSAQVYERIFPSLVYIQVKGADTEEQEGFGVGSGVVINEAGDILTAFHVVSGAAQIMVIYSDGTHAAAVISGSDPENDIAILASAEPPGLIVPAVLGNPNAMRVGDQAFAVGNPLGLVASLSAGVISGFNRSIPLNDEGDVLGGLIQFDTAVNPGNSGGPLLNRSGQVIGIVTALANPSEQNFFVGIGFAVPIDTAGGTAGAPGY